MPTAPVQFELLAQASLLCMASAARYWMRLFEVWTKHAPSLGGMLLDQQPFNLAAPTGSDRLILALRELADLPLDEVRRLRNDLEQLASQARPSESSSSSPYWRRWEVKT